MIVTSSRRGESDSLRSNLTVIESGRLGAGRGDLSFPIDETNRPFKMLLMYWGEIVYEGLARMRLRKSDDAMPGIGEEL